jgi:hypothetical protein
MSQTVAAICAVQVKIGDFGFTKRLSGNKASMQVKRITHPRWVAPEVRARGNFTPQLF